MWMYVMNVLRPFPFFFTLPFYLPLYYWRRPGNAANTNLLITVTAIQLVLFPGPSPPKKSQIQILCACTKYFFSDWLLHKWREGYLLPTWALKITCQRFNWMLELSSGQNKLRQITLSLPLKKILHTYPSLGCSISLYTLVSGVICVLYKPLPIADERYILNPSCMWENADTQFTGAATKSNGILKGEFFGTHHAE